LSTDEVADLISVLHRDATITGHRYQILSSHNKYYHHNNLSCAEGEATSIMLDLSGMNQVLNVDKSQRTVTVQSGILFEVCG
jgi:FAD/FMN-containing dehydrogenase